MNKAEEKIQKWYPTYPTLAEEYAFIDGYEQAEKDLELTWEDIAVITDVWYDLHEDESVWSVTGCDTPAFYQEVLKRFKETKRIK